ncbi:hypothetical protein LPY66_19010 [Dehalobacter sp. DCM]|uniref:hypothetical protein n=1 Tax=Dehalobacter sp. DCM TaxID=2907827 RepID=UPI003081D542|nr:hypothetical protein LPY66_19010 [Dehalobacter sp. DCM]
MMRISSIAYNQDKDCDCTGCTFRDEKQISTYILSFQIADLLLKRLKGNWQISRDHLVLTCEELENPLSIDYSAGIINYGSLSTTFYHRYNPAKGISVLVEDICNDLMIRSEEAVHANDYLFSLFVKLIEIFHARCNLRIEIGSTEGEWVLRLSEGTAGWIKLNGIAENRFGEKIDTTQWQNMRIEKAALYLFGFNSFCKNFQCPMK